MRECGLRINVRRLRKLTSAFVGDTNTKLSGLAIRNIKDSTLNCDPRLITEKKSTPKALANSLYVNLAEAKK